MPARRWHLGQAAESVRTFAGGLTGKVAISALATVVLGGLRYLIEHIFKQ
jgi:hypothetical protein